METPIRQWEARGQVLKQGQRACGIQGTEGITCLEPAFEPMSTDEFSERGKGDRGRWHG